jgi:hypothetical protein
MDLLEMIDSEQNRLEHASAAVRGEIVAHVNYLRKQLKRIDRDIDGAVRKSELWRHQSELMDSVPGVGPVLRASVLAWLPELGQLNRAKPASWSGLRRCPMTAEKSVAIGTLPADVGHCAKSCSWPLWARCCITLICAPITIVYVPGASCTRSPWLPPCVKAPADS